jgi:hypothetical protein
MWALTEPLILLKEGPGWNTPIEQKLNKRSTTKLLEPL